jgi:hypothetical protein
VIIDFEYTMDYKVKNTIKSEEEKFDCVEYAREQ